MAGGAPRPRGTLDLAAVLAPDDGVGAVGQRGTRRYAAGLPGGEALEEGPAGRALGDQPQRTGGGGGLQRPAVHGGAIAGGEVEPRGERRGQPSPREAGEGDPTPRGDAGELLRAPQGLSRG